MLSENAHFNRYKTQTDINKETLSYIVKCTDSENKSHVRTLMFWSALRTTEGFWLIFKSCFLFYESHEGSHIIITFPVVWNVIAYFANMVC